MRAGELKSELLFFGSLGVETPAMLANKPMMRCLAMNEALPSRSLGNEAPAWQTSMHQHDHTGHLHQSASTPCGNEAM